MAPRSPRSRRRSRRSPPPRDRRRVRHGHDAQGRLVPDLSRDDFAIDDNGKRQTLTLFANDIQPITVVMLLDRSGSMSAEFQAGGEGGRGVRRARWVRTTRRASAASRTAFRSIRADFTSDHDELLKILRTELQPEGPTPLWNAVDVGIDKLLLEQGRRVVLVFTDGVDRPMNFSSSNKSLKDVMKRAEEEDVMVYAIGLAGETGMPSLGGRGADRGGRGGCGRAGLADRRPWSRAAAGRPQLEKPDEGLPKIAAATGGGYFELTSARRSRRDLHAGRRRAAPSVRAGLHAGEARRQDARPDRSRGAARSHGAGTEALPRLTQLGIENQESGIRNASAMFVSQDRSEFPIANP